MKFYDFAAEPSPRCVRIFLAGKGIEVPTVQVELRGGAVRFKTASLDGLPNLKRWHDSASARPSAKA